MTTDRPSSSLRHETRPRTGDGAAAWSLPDLAGRLCELSGSAGSTVLSLACGFVLEAQFQGEPASWITHRRHGFFPPDAAAAGVDLDALVVVRLDDAPGPDLARAFPRFAHRRPYAPRAARAAEQLARSGAFGLIVLDLGAEHTLPAAVQARLAGLAKAHGTTILCLTDKSGDAASIGSLVSWRAHTHKVRIGVGRFRGTADVSKDKRRGPGWSHTEVYRGPPGLY